MFYRAEHSKIPVGNALQEATVQPDLGRETRYKRPYASKGGQDQGKENGLGNEGGVNGSDFQEILNA